MSALLKQLVAWGWALLDASGLRTGNAPRTREDAEAFARTVMSEHYFTPDAARWLLASVTIVVDDFSSTRGGGYWLPARREVRLFTAQHEAAVHELAHAWWHYRREGNENDFIEATVRLSAEPNPVYGELARLAHGYVHGIPEQGWEGLYLSRNDWEMFAGIASGTLGDMRKLPPYIRRFYSGLFIMPENDRGENSASLAT